MDEACTICGGTKDEHEELNHEFNLNNQLIPKQRTASRPQSRAPIMVVGAIDTQLRKILLDKGILTNEDFAPVRNSGSGPDGDRETGSTEGS